MKTARKVIDKATIGLLEVNDVIEHVNIPDIITAMKEYAGECIREDRKNVAEHAKIQKIFTSGYKYETSIVKKSSIINAPQITLL